MFSTSSTGFFVPIKKQSQEQEWGACQSIRRKPDRGRWRKNLCTACTQTKGIDKKYIRWLNKLRRKRNIKTVSSIITSIRSSTVLAGYSKANVDDVTIHRKPDDWLHVRWASRPSGAAPASSPTARWSAQFLGRWSVPWKRFVCFNGCLN